MIEPTSKCMRIEGQSFRVRKGFSGYGFFFKAVERSVVPRNRDKVTAYFSDQSTMMPLLVVGGTILDCRIVMDEESWRLVSATKV